VGPSLQSEQGGTHEDGSFYHWMTWEKNKPIPDTGQVKVKYIPLSKIKEVKFK
jgi:hypothetical protein